MTVSSCLETVHGVKENMEEFGKVARQRQSAFPIEGVEAFH